MKNQEILDFLVNLSIPKKVLVTASFSYKLICATTECYGLWRNRISASTLPNRDNSGKYNLERQVRQFVTELSLYYSTPILLNAASRGSE